MKTFTVRRGYFDRQGRFVGETFDCDQLPEPLYTDAYVAVTRNRTISREVVDAALKEEV